MMDSNEQAHTDKHATNAGDMSELNADNTQDRVQRGVGDAGGGSGATDSITAGVGGTQLPDEEVNRQRRETPGGDVSKRDDNIKTD